MYKQDRHNIKEEKLDLELSNKQVLITGGSKGIGLASAIALAKEGAHIHLVSGNAQTLAKAADELKTQTGTTAQTTALDLSLQENREQLAPVLKIPTSWLTMPVPFPVVASRKLTLHAGAKHGI